MRWRIEIGALAGAALLFMGVAACRQAVAPGLSEGTLSATAEGGFFDDLLRAYTPRRLCMNEEPTVMWLHIVSDLLIAGAYFSIPVALVVFIRRRRDLAFNWIFQMFALFIFACGITHLFGVWSIWQSLYRLDGLMKLFTGIVSVATAIMLWRLIPAAVALPSPQALATANTKLMRMHQELEHRVEDRTHELRRRSGITSR